MRFLKALKDSVKEIISEIGFYVNLNVKLIFDILLICCFYSVYLFGIYGQGKVFTVFTIILIVLIDSIFRTVINKMNCGDSFPVPNKRYTKRENDEISIDKDDLQEVILYLGEVEDYLERKGFLK